MKFKNIHNILTKSRKHVNAQWRIIALMCHGCEQIKKEKADGMSHQYFVATSLQS